MSRLSYNDAQTLSEIEYLIIYKVENKELKTNLYNAYKECLFTHWEKYEKTTE